MINKLIIITISLIFFSCSNNNNGTFEEEKRILNEMLEELKDIGNSIQCIDPEEWSYTAFGSKACGGPQGYLAYSHKINVSQFLKKVAEYTDQENEFNLKWGVASDCAVEPAPIDLICEEGKAILIY